MAMTSNGNRICELTGLGIGKVFLRGNNYNPQTEGNQIFDEKTGNFHLFPVIDKEEIEKWKEYLNLEAKLWGKLQDALGKDFIKNKQLPTGKVWDGNNKEDKIPAIYKENDLNHFFRYLEVIKGERHYLVLFKRFYIDESNCVNCIYGEIQFYSTLDKEGNPNEKSSDKWIIYYPKSYKGQNEKMIRLSKTDNSVNMYNPKGFQSFSDLSEDANLEKYAESVAESFKNYIEQIENKNA